MSDKKGIQLVAEFTNERVISFHLNYKAVAQCVNNKEADLPVRYMQLALHLGLVVMVNFDRQQTSLIIEIQIINCLHSNVFVSGGKRTFYFNCIINNQPF